MARSITFFNNKGGVGKTTLVYHLAWMFSRELGKKVLAVDLDPQSNLTSMFLSQERLETVYLEESERNTILHAIEPVANGEPYIPVHIENITENMNLIIGNLALSVFEDKLSDAWTKCLNGDVYSFRLTSLFHTIITEAATRCEADLILIDVGPNLGAINRSVLIASDNIVIPVAGDLFSLQGIKNLGKTLTQWKEQWAKRRTEYKGTTLALPQNGIVPIGYILLQHSARESRPVKSYIRWADRIPQVYSEFVLNSKSNVLKIEGDKNCLGMLKHYHSLAPMAMEARKPMFLLKPADGAIGAHVAAVNRCYADFLELASYVLEADE